MSGQRCRAAAAAAAAVGRRPLLVLVPCAVALVAPVSRASAGRRHQHAAAHRRLRRAAASRPRARAGEGDGAGEREQAGLPLLFREQKTRRPASIVIDAPSGTPSSKPWLIGLRSFRGLLSRRPVGALESQTREGSSVALSADVPSFLWLRSLARARGVSRETGDYSWMARCRDALFCDRFFLNNEPRSRRLGRDGKKRRRRACARAPQAGSERAPAVRRAGGDSSRPPWCLERARHHPPTCSSSTASA